MRKINYKLPVIIFKEGKSFIAYTPALDLSTCGKTKAEAKRMFEEAADIFFEELQRKGTTDAVLKDFGWVKQNVSKWKAPEIVGQSLLTVSV